MHKLPDDYEAGAGARELEALAEPEPQALFMMVDLSAAIAGDLENGTTHAEVWLDWAAALREREGLSWAQALRAAQVLYYG